MSAHALDLLKLLLWRRAVAGLVLAAALVAPSTAPAESALSVLSYNVHGLPRWFAGDDPHTRVKVIASLANGYDVVLFQEDFEYHSIIGRRMADSVRAAGNGVSFDPRRLAARVLLAPIAFAVPRFSFPYGAGLSTFVKPALAVPRDVGRAPFRVCDGWFGARMDCWASKGYLRVGVQTSEGTVVDVYSTHLDAGRSKRSSKTRRRQLKILAAAIEKQSAGQAVIVGGDLNLAADEPRDRDVLMEFRERLNLRDSGAGPELPVWNSRDYILYRSGVQAEIAVDQAGEALEFAHDSRALSDHPAVYARFRVKPIAGDAAPAAEERSGPHAP